MAVRREVENPLWLTGYPASQKPDPHAAASAGGSGGNQSKEILRPSIVEVRFADLEKDMRAIAKIFGQPSVIEHLAGIAPAVTNRDIKRFRERLPELMPGISVDPNEIVIAAEGEIGNYLKSKDPSKTRLLIAESKGPKPEVIGTITVEKPGGGITIASVSKLAVSEKARGRGIGFNLVKAASALALCRVEGGGWGYDGVSAGIIQVSGSELPQKVFQKNNYIVQGTRRNGCISWSNEHGLFVSRDVLLVLLDGSNFKPDPQHLPKKTA